MPDIQVATFPSTDSIRLTKLGDMFFNSRLVFEELDEIEITEILDNIHGFLQQTVKELAVYEFDPNNGLSDSVIYYTIDDYLEYYCSWSRIEDDKFVLDAYMHKANNSSGYCIFSEHEFPENGFESAKRLLIKDVNKCMNLLEDAFYG